jgi:hypothetical protein
VPVICLLSVEGSPFPLATLHDLKIRGNIELTTNQRITSENKLKMWGFSHDQTSLPVGSDLGAEDYRYQDLCQENAILKQELSDLYSHLMIIDDSIELNDENSKISSVGRLIVYDKAKKDTEILLTNESSRQKICVLEKELSFQHTHLKDQAAKMKEMENKLLEAKQQILRLELDVVNSVSMRTKVKELTAQVETLNSKYFLTNKTSVELEQKLSVSFKRTEDLENELQSKSILIVELNDRLVLSEGKLKGVCFTAVKFRIN